VAVLSSASFCSSGSIGDGSVVPVLTGGTGGSPVVLVGQIPTKLDFAVNCTSGSTGESPVVPVGYFLAKSLVG
jgi:hypothetical protein